MSQLTVSSLTFRHIQDVSFSIEPGQIVSLSGASGSGKTLLLRAIADLDPYTGSVFLNGLDCKSIPAPEWRKNVGLLPAESQWWHSQVGDHFSQPDQESLGLLGFENDVMKWSVSRLSTGEKQRLAMIRLLCNSPKVLLLDEPTASLDVSNIEKAERVILDYITSHQASALWVSHDASQEERMASLYLRIDHNTVIPISK